MRGASFLVLAAALGCEGHGRPELAPIPAIDGSARVLHDEAALATFIDAFPADKYKVYDVKTLGKMYIDDTTDVIKGVLAKGLPWERYLNDTFKQYLKDGDIALDIGAHIGSHTLALAKQVGEHGHVYAFEPQMKLYRELVMNLRINHVANVTPLRFALGAGEPRVVHMAPASEHNEGGTGIGEGGDAVELRALDSFAFPRVALAKIDVEGYEDNVLEGARALIAAQHPVLVVEIYGSGPYEKAPPEVRARIDATKQKLVSMGYTVERLAITDYLAVPAKP